MTSILLRARPVQLMTSKHQLRDTLHPSMTRPANMTTARRMLRAFAAAGVVAAVAFLGAPLDARHTIDFETYDCSSSTPDEEPDLTPPPTEPPDGGEAPPSDQERTPSPQDCMPAEGDRIWGTRSVRFRTSTSGESLRRVAFYILSLEETIPSPNEGRPLIEELYPRDMDITSYNVPFEWDSRELTPFNGKYKIRVEVESYSPNPLSNEIHSAAKERLNLNVDNAPLSVTAPTVVATTQSSATITWSTAVEPDKLSYTVYRAEGSKKPAYGAFKAIGVSQGEGFRDATVKPGSHWYAVKVTRRSVVTPDTGISSALSPISDAAVVRTPTQVKEEEEDGKKVLRKIPFRNLAPPRPSSRLAGVADAPFAYKLPYDDDDAVPEAFGSGSSSEGGSDPRGPVLPVAVGMFLVSSALAVGRMPY
jgi:hypothetical protein